MSRLLGLDHMLLNADEEPPAQPVSEAFVPIIKAVISGIEIDFAFGTIQRDKVRSAGLGWGDCYADSPSSTPRCRPTST